jgi:hypothetical protein
MGNLILNIEYFVYLKAKLIINFPVQKLDLFKNKNAELLHTGSYLLGTLTVSSDVDTICMLPEGITLIMFFGHAKCEIVEPNSMGIRGQNIGRNRTCADNSLHCIFCLVIN